MNSKKFYDSSNSYKVELGSTDTLTADRLQKLPDASGNVVLDNATQTLTNKTLTSPIINQSTQTVLGTTPVGTVSITEYASGKNVATVLTLTNFIVGALAGAGAALGVGNIVYVYPAGTHVEGEAYFNLSLTCVGTAVTTKSGLGSVIATGAVSVLNGTSTFMDRLTEQSVATASTGGTAVIALAHTTAGVSTGIALNVAANVKNVFLNSAGTWNSNNTGNLTATGTIVLLWTRVSAS